MFGLFNKKSEEEKLQETYNRLMKEWHTLSSTNRSASDKKYAEAQEILSKLDTISKK